MRANKNEMRNGNKNGQRVTSHLKLGSVFQMYSEGSDVVPQSNETALHYFKKAADMVSLPDSVC